MASGASRQDLRHVSPFSSGSGRRLAIEPQLLAQPGAIGVITRQEGAEQNPFTGDRLVISGNREDPGNPLALDGEAIGAEAQDPLAIEKLMKGMSAVRQAR